MYLIIIMSLIITMSLIIIMFLIITSSQYFSKMSNGQSLQLILVLFSSSSNIGNFLIKHCNLSASDLHSGKLRGLRWTLFLLLIQQILPHFAKTKSGKFLFTFSHLSE